MTFGKEKLQTSTTNPYSAVMPGIDEAAAAASDWFNSNKGPLAPLNRNVKDALNQTRALAGQPVQGLSEANAFTKGLISNGGWTPELRQTADGIRGAMTQANDYYTPFMNGSYTEDPRLQKQLDINANRALNGAATRFGGGRYGTAGIGQNVGTAVADANNGIMLQSNENTRNRQLQAIGANSGFQLQGNGLLGQMGEGARGAAMQGVSQLPMLNNLGYANIERLAGVGDYQQNRTQQIRDNPYTKLQQYTGLLGQMGGTGSTTTAPKPGSNAQSLIGGASLGAGIGAGIGQAVPKIGGWGTAIGGLGGGLLGLLG